jgi:hypothetical protein
MYVFSVYNATNFFVLHFRLYTDPITKKAKDTETNTIKNILYNNDYDYLHIQR